MCVCVYVIIILKEEMVINVMIRKDQGGVGGRDCGVEMM